MSCSSGLRLTSIAWIKAGRPFGRVVAPSLQRARHLGGNVFYDLLAEDPPGQGLSVEGAQPVEAGEAASM